MSPYTIFTRPAEGRGETLEAFSGETKDIVIAIREICRAISEDGVRSGKAARQGKDVSWSVEVRK
jgi:hypothetical protein